MLDVVSLSLIVGPPNSGRSGEIQTRLDALLGEDPILVVPTADDATRFERELCAGGRAVLGASIQTFRRLSDQVAAATDAALRPGLTAAQRLALVRAAARETELRTLSASAARRGFAPALDRLIGELQGALVGPNELAHTAELLDDGSYELELARLYAAYEGRRDAAGRDDQHSAARKAVSSLRERPASWGSRPVLLYGFDDLTEEQLELVTALARACDVMVAVNYADREALAARAELLTVLRDQAGAATVAELPFDESYSPSATLRHLDQHLFEPGAPRIQPDDGIALLECAGDRGEAEAIGGEVARLLAGGVPPGEVSWRWLAQASRRETARSCSRSCARARAPSLSASPTGPSGACVAVWRAPRTISWPVGGRRPRRSPRCGRPVRAPSGCGRWRPPPTSSRSARTRSASPWRIRATAADQTSRSCRSRCAPRHSPRPRSRSWRRWRRCPARPPPRRCKPSSSSTRPACRCGEGQPRAG